MNTTNNGLCKAERLCSKNTIEKLFAGDAKSFSIFPLRVVFMPIERTDNPPASIMISVSKKKFKRAVKRNKVKRQIREGYRKNKHQLLDNLKDKDHNLVMAFIYLSNEIYPTEKIEETIKLILEKLNRKIE